eukprot:9470375-Pyramimonas_sp.AAC.2
MSRVSRERGRAEGFERAIAAKPSSNGRSGGGGGGSRGGGDEEGGRLETEHIPKHVCNYGHRWKQSLEENRSQGDELTLTFCWPLKRPKWRGGWKDASARTASMIFCFFGAMSPSADVSERARVRVSAGSGFAIVRSARAGAARLAWLRRVGDMEPSVVN